MVFLNLLHQPLSLGCFYAYLLWGDYIVIDAWWEELLQTFLWRKYLFPPPSNTPFVSSCTLQILYKHPFRWKIERKISWNGLQAHFIYHFGLSYKRIDTILKDIFKAMYLRFWYMAPWYIGIVCCVLLHFFDI